MKQLTFKIIIIIKTCAKSNWVNLASLNLGINQIITTKESFQAWKWTENIVTPCINLGSWVILHADIHCHIESWFKVWKHLSIWRESQETVRSKNVQKHLYIEVSAHYFSKPWTSLTVLFLLIDGSLLKITHTLTDILDFCACVKSFRPPLHVSITIKHNLCGLVA